MLLASSLLLYLVTSGIVLVTTSVGYHRALCHGAITIHPFFHKLLLTWGVWVTAIDPKTWVVMHRMHHLYSDQPLDPHSPKNAGFLGMFFAQMNGYNNTVDALLAKQEPQHTIGNDLPLCWPTRNGYWPAPYVLHALIGVLLGFTVHWMVGAALVAGLWSHAFHGIVINYFGHSMGGRNFDTPDNSRNNHGAAWMLLGEGFQNNHHRFPASARFSYRPIEFDPGYVVCRVLETVGVVKIQQETLIPEPVVATA